MHNQELNAYIYNYCKNDLTSSVLLLTGPYGSGKSHYLRTSLAPYLYDTPEEICCIPVSLREIGSLEQLSRDIFMEIRTKLLRPKKEARAVGTILAKTVLKNIGRYLDIDLIPDEKDRDNLFRSIDLTGKLIIFEDIENCGMDRGVFYKYVSSLAGSDRVKVLIAVSDSDLIREISAKVPVNIIRYQADYPGVIKAVFATYDHPALNSLATEETIREIELLGEVSRTADVRALFAACQKTVDLYRLMKTDTIQYDQEFLKSVFMGNLLFLAGKRRGKDVSWGDEDQLSYRLGGSSYPLFRFCYEFIVNGIFEFAQVSKAEEVLKAIRTYDAKRAGIADPDLSVLYTWYYQKEEDIVKTVASVSKRLQDPEAFALEEYGRIAACMLGAEHLLGCDVTEAKRLLTANLTAKGMKVSSDFISRYLVPCDDDPETVRECDDLKKRMLDALRKVDTQLFGFSYQPDQIEGLSRTVSAEKDRILRFGAFARALDNGKITEMLKRCSAKQIYDFHAAYVSIYRTPGIRAYFSGDRPSVIDLAARLCELESFGGYDRIQKRNLQDFILDLGRIEQLLEDR